MCLPRDEEILPQTRSPALLLQNPASLFALLLLSSVTLGKPLKLLPSPQTGGATLTYLTTVFWDSPAASAVEEQSLLCWSVSLFSLAAFIFRRCAIASGSLTSLGVPFSCHHALRRGCWGAGGLGAWCSDIGSGWEVGCFPRRVSHSPRNLLTGSKMTRGPVMSTPAAGKPWLGWRWGLSTLPHPSPLCSAPWSGLGPARLFLLAWLLVPSKSLWLCRRWRGLPRRDTTGRCHHLRLCRMCEGGGTGSVLSGGSSSVHGSMGKCWCPSQVMRCRTRRGSCFAM